MLLFNCVILSSVLFSGHILALVELPQVDENNILTTEAAIRDTINTLFYQLGLRGVNTKPRLKEYSTVHKNLVSFTLQDYTNLKEIAKLTRVDKTKISNETGHFMAVINELLNEDVEENTEGTVGEANDESVVKYIDQFQTNLKNLKEQYGVSNEKFRIKDEVYQILKDDDDTFFYNLTMDNSDTDIDDNDTLIDGNFWKPEVSGRRIYRGDRTKIKHFPFMASVQIFNRFHCSGSIIKSDLIITASSCLQLAWNNRFFRENPAFLSVRVGTKFYNGGGELIPVFEVYFHPKYNPRNLWNNICILRLTRKLYFKRKGRRLKKINFDRRDSNLPMTTDGVTIVGWGARTSSSVVGNPWDNVLSFAILDVYPLQECQEIYSREYVTHKNFCAGFFSKGGGACNRDVGGPGIVDGILMGVISFGSPVCGTPDAPTVFTKLGYYTDWIEEIMEQHVYYANQRTTLKQKMEITLGQYYKPIESTTFKIAPIVGKMKPIPINEVDSLRMPEQDVGLFQDFLKTMFGADQASEYTDLLQDTNTRTSNNIDEETAISKPEGILTAVEDTTPIDVPFEESEAFVTEMGRVEPNLGDATTPDDILMKVTSLDASMIRVDKNNELEKNLVSLIDDIDLKEVIEGLPSVEGDKLLEESKVMDVFKDQKPEQRMSKLDNSVLTLLYLSDSEKATKAYADHPEELSMKEYQDFEEDSETETEGLSIPIEGNLRDLTYRNKKDSGAFYDMPRTAMYYPVAKTVNTTIGVLL